MIRRVTTFEAFDLPAGEPTISDEALERLWEGPGALGAAAGRRAALHPSGLRCLDRLGGQGWSAPSCRYRGSRALAAAGLRGYLKSFRALHQLQCRKSCSASSTSSCTISAAGCTAFTPST